MHGPLSTIGELLAGIVAPTVPQSAVEVVLCPPSTYIDQVGREIENSALSLGGQNCARYDSGAYTGEVSAQMLADLGCKYVIIGHSERRKYFHESDQEIAEKFKQAQAQHLQPILCVGETQQQREDGCAESVVAQQLDTVLAAVGVDGFAKAVLAYEPVWAIGTGLTASPQQAQEMHSFIRGMIAEHSVDVAQKLSVLYGGSVKPENANNLFEQPDIDGGLIGGASLEADKFNAIVKAAL